MDENIDPNLKSGEVRIRIEFPVNLLSAWWKKDRSKRVAFIFQFHSFEEGSLVTWTLGDNLRDRSIVEMVSPCLAGRLELHVLKGQQTQVIEEIERILSEVGYGVVNSTELKSSKGK